MFECACVREEKRQRESDQTSAGVHIHAHTCVRDCMMDSQFMGLVPAVCVSMRVCVCV